MEEIEKTKVPADKIENPVNQKPAKKPSIVVHVDTVEIDLAKQKANELVAVLEKAHELIHSLSSEQIQNQPDNRLMEYLQLCTLSYQEQMAKQGSVSFGPKQSQCD